MSVYVLATHDTSCKWLHLPAVCHGSNTCVCVIEMFTMCENAEQRIYIKFCFKTGKPETETYQLLEQA